MILNIHQVRPFEYIRPAHLEEAFSGLGPRTRPFAGGTDLLPLMKADIAAPVKLVDIKRVLEAGIRADGDGVAIGALTVLEEIESDSKIKQSHTALAEACAAAASPQLRNMATIGGNLLQRPRCWYFRNPRVRCWLKGGDRCAAEEGDNRRHALFGASPCRAVHPSDPAAALIALDAEVRLCGPRGERTVPAGEFFMLPHDARRTETVIEDDELVAAIRLPASTPGAQGASRSASQGISRSTYLKAMERKAWTFALAGVAASLRLSDDGTIDDARIVLTGVAPIPWRAIRCEEVLRQKTPDRQLFEKAAEAAVEGAAPLMHNGYKLPLVAALVKRALGRLNA